MLSPETHWCGGTFAFILYGKEKESLLNVDTSQYIICTCGNASKIKHFAVREVRPITWTEYDYHYLEKSPCRLIETRYVCSSQDVRKVSFLYLCIILLVYVVSIFGGFNSLLLFVIHFVALKKTYLKLLRHYSRVRMESPFLLTSYATWKSSCKHWGGGWFKRNSITIASNLKAWGYKGSDFKYLELICCDYTSTRKIIGSNLVKEPKRFYAI